MPLSRRTEYLLTYKHAHLALPVAGQKLLAGPKQQELTAAQLADAVASEQKEVAAPMVLGRPQDFSVEVRQGFTGLDRDGQSRIGRWTACSLKGCLLPGIGIHSLVYTVRYTQFGEL